MDEKGGKRQLDHINRINYDDVNESMTNRSVVHKVLRKLSSDSQKGNINTYFQAITSLPYGYEGDGETPNYNPEIACEWWRKNAFSKTFRERRSYLQIFRMFWRLFAFHAILFHELLIIVN